MSGLICLSLPKKKFLSLQKVLTSSSVRDFPHDMVEIVIAQKQANDGALLERLIGLSAKPLLIKFYNHPSQETLELLGKKKIFGFDLNMKFTKKLSLPKRKKIKIIISQHLKKPEFSYEKLAHKIQKMYELGADIAKLVMPYASKTASKQISLLSRLIHESGKPVIAHLSGIKGHASRLTLFNSGSHITYIAQNEKEKTAPGQWTMREWMRIVRA